MLIIIDIESQGREKDSKSKLSKEISTRKLILSESSRTKNYISNFFRRLIMNSFKYFFRFTGDKIINDSNSGVIIDFQRFRRKR